MIRVMNDVAPEPTLRERQAESTRLAIIDAYLGLSHRDGAVTVSIPGVALESGVSVRTVYRYFQTKDELQTAAAYRMSEQALFGGTMSDSTPDNLADQLKMLWSGLADNIPAVIAERTAPAGRAIRVTRLAGARKTSAAAFSHEADPESVDLIIAVTSSSMFLELVERMDYPPEVAATMATRLVELIMKDEKNAAEHDPKEVAK